MAITQKGGVFVTGDKAIDRQLRNLGGKASKKAARAGIRASMKPVAKACRSAITATQGASTGLKREARKSIGQRFGKIKAGKFSGDVQARVGFSVGKRRRDSKGRRVVSSAAKGRAKRIKGGQKDRGVGIGPENIHWFVLGTERRDHDTRSVRVKGGGRRTEATGNPKHNTGRIKKVFKSVTKVALAASKRASTAAAHKKIRDVLKAETNKHSNTKRRRP